MNKNAYYDRLQLISCNIPDKKYYIGLPQFDYIEPLVSGCYIIAGPPNSFRTTFALNILKALSGTELCFYMDLNHHLHKYLLESVGCPLDSFFYSRSSSFAVLPMVEQNAVNVLIVDTISMMEKQLLFLKEINYTLHRSRNNNILVLLLANLVQDNNGLTISKSIKKWSNECCNSIIELNTIERKRDYSITSVKCYNPNTCTENRYVVFFKDHKFHNGLNTIYTANRLDLVDRSGDYICFGDSKFTLSDVINESVDITAVESKLRSETIWKRYQKT